MNEHTSDCAVHYPTDGECNCQPQPGEGTRAFADLLNLLADRVPAIKEVYHGPEVAALTPLIYRALHGEATIRRQALEDAKQGIRRRSNDRPALMNPDVMRHIAANVELWADHEVFIREFPIAGEDLRASAAGGPPQPKEAGQ